ncbi:unnamed protein product, partial [Urochloa humidicola]
PSQSSGSLRSQQHIPIPPLRPPSCSLAQSRRHTALQQLAALEPAPSTMRSSRRRLEAKRSLTTSGQRSAVLWKRRSYRGHAKLTEGRKGAGELGDEVADRVVPA